MDKMLKKKKAQARFTIGDLSGIGVTLVVVAVVLGIGATILTNIQTNVQPSAFNVSNSGSWNVAYNSTAYGLTGINTLASYVPTIALVVVAAVVIGIILVFFTNSNK